MPVAKLQIETPAELMDRITAIPTEEAMVAVLESLSEEEYASLPECPICRKFYPDKKPNAESLAAMREAEEGKTKSFDSWEEFMEDLNADYKKVYSAGSTKELLEKLNADA